MRIKKKSKGLLKFLIRIITTDILDPEDRKKKVSLSEAKS